MHTTLARILSVPAAAAVALAALGACSSQHREIRADAACADRPAAPGHPAAEAVGEPYFGAEFAAQQTALGARPPEAQPEAF